MYLWCKITTVSYPIPSYVRTPRRPVWISEIASALLSRKSCDADVMIFSNVA